MNSFVNVWGQDFVDLDGGGRFISSCINLNRGIIPPLPSTTLLDPVSPLAGSTVAAAAAVMNLAVVNSSWLFGSSSFVDVHPTTPSSSVSYPPSTRVVPSYFSIFCSLCFE